MFVVTVLFRIVPGHEAAFEAAMLENAKASLDNEPGCHVFDVAKGAAGEIYLYELYDDRAAFEAHMKMPHFLDFDARVAPWTAEKHVALYTKIS